MNKIDIINLMNSNPVFYLATVEGSVPRVRGMLLYRADETGVIFHTGTMKNLYKQLGENPNVELCFNCNNGVQLRVSGKVVEVNDDNIKNEILSHPSRDFAKGWIDSGLFKYEEFVVYKVKYKEATVWSMDKNFEPNEIINLKDISNITQIIEETKNVERKQ